MVGYYDPRDHSHYGYEHQGEQAPEADRVGEQPERGDHKHVSPGSEGRGYGALEGGKHLPGAVGEHHPGPEPEVPERPRGGETGVDVHGLHVLVRGIYTAEGSNRPHRLRTSSGRIVR